MKITAYSIRSTMSAVWVAGTLLLVGCLVEEKNIPTHTRTSDNLRIYQDHDYLTYNVNGTKYFENNYQNISGEMETSWKVYDPLKIDGKTVVSGALQRKTELKFDGEIDAGRNISIHYQTQDVDGNIFDHAVEAVSGLNESHYWFGNTPGSGATVIPIEILASPFIAGTSYDVKYNVNDNCTASGDNNYSCNDAIGNLATTNVISTETDIVYTPKGKFDAFKVTYSGSQHLENAFLLFDIRAFCTESQGLAYFDGTAWYFPEVGLVKIINKCTVGSTIVNITVELSDTNIKF